MRYVWLVLLPWLLTGCGKSGTTPEAIPRSLLPAARSASCLNLPLSEVETAIFPDRNDSPRFHYRFYLRKGKAPRGKPTIVFLPGGPGDTSIDKAAQAESAEGIPDDYDVVFTDPRGRGCNEAPFASQSAEAFSTAYLAADVIAAIEKLGLRDYLLFGHSYGTVLATAIGSRIAERHEVPAPRSVVLMGILGKHVEDTYVGIRREWQAAKPSISPKVMSRLTGHPLPLEGTAQEWGKLLTAGLFEGVPTADPSVFSMIEILLLGTPAQQQRLANLLKAFGAVGNDPVMLKMNKPIWCRELARRDNMDVALVDGDLVGNQNPGYCDGFPRMDRAYDSATELLDGPLFYLEGDRDPATIPEQATYHFEHQRRARRYFLSVHGAGHLPLQNQLGDCRRALWQAMTQDGQGIDAAAASCRTGVKVEKREPGA